MGEPIFVGDEDTPGLGRRMYASDPDYEVMRLALHLLGVLTSPQRWHVHGMFPEPERQAHKEKMLAVIRNLLDGGLIRDWLSKQEIEAIEEMIDAEEEGEESNE